MNTPNKLTVFRMCLVPVIVIVSLINIPGSLLGIPSAYWIMDLLFVIGAITDKIDGTLARKNNQVTNFGKFLDPIADKVLVISALIILVGDGRLPSWIPIIIIFREFAVSGYRLIAVQQDGKVVAANIWGKLKTVSQMIAIIMALVDINSFGAFIKGGLSPVWFAWNLITTIMMIVCTIATIFSGYEYLKDGKDLLKDA
ncbi:MAG: CDP-diacylglycerol--glycerol-3-phosphate 3-phosphatidyltransferase [bacterium]|nr:CDP-diacylglycerol--glycerol-3-phosphate 3-phosphatidyltransferase [bacterium]